MLGEAKRLGREHEARMAAAWHTAALGRVKTFPSFADFTGIKPVMRKLTPDEMKARFQAMRESAG